MKFFTSKQIKGIDHYTIVNEPISSVDLMERAACALFGSIAMRMAPSQRVIVFCGSGNNGGDGLALARMLYLAGYNVQVYCLSADSYSSDFAINLGLLKGINVPLNLITENLPILSVNDIVVDALFGSGLNRPLDGAAEKLVRYINGANSKVISIDIPSGLFGERNPYPNNNPVVEADVCLSLQFPKLSFFFAENERYVKNWEVLPIGLHPQIIEELPTPYCYITLDVVKSKVISRGKFSHKGTFGHCLVVAGSYGMMGAASLCALAAAKSGAGLVTMHIPKCGYSVAQGLVPVAMCEVDLNETVFTSIDRIDKYRSVCVGPGLGTNSKTVQGLIELIKKVKCPLLLDADALNIIADNLQMLKHIPKNTIITPHPGEFDRLFGSFHSGYERLSKAIEASQLYNLIIVLKGAHTQIITPSGAVAFNSTGNAGMATGGSGDVLSGVIVALLAQGYSPVDSATIGVYVHGLAGDMAEKYTGKIALSAEDIIEWLPLAFKSIEND